VEHAGHWPCQRGVSLPHSVQKNAVFTLAIRESYPSRGEGLPAPGDDTTPRAP